MILHDCKQRGHTWRSLRAGRITGTAFRCMANGTEAGREKLCQRIADERRHGYVAKEGFISEAMQRGIELEAEAREMFEIGMRGQIQEVGFVEMDDLVGCSPDGFIVGWGSGIEIKCPAKKTHERYLKEGSKAWMSSYRWQVQGSMWVTRLERWYFVSYNPDLPTHQRLFVDEVFPDRESFAKLEAGAEFCRKRIAEIEESADALQDR